GSIAPVGLARCLRPPELYGSCTGLFKFDLRSESLFDPAISQPGFAGRPGSVAGFRLFQRKMHERLATHFRRFRIKLQPPYPSVRRPIEPAAIRRTAAAPRRILDAGCAP